MRCLRELDWFAAGGQRQVREQEIADRTFIKNAPRPTIGKPVIRQRFESDGRDPLEVGAEAQVVDVAFRLVAAGENRSVVEDRQDRHVGLSFAGPQHGPAHRAIRLAFAPRGQLALEVIAPANFLGTWVVIPLAEQDPEFSKRVLRAVLLVELDRPANLSADLLGRIDVKHGRAIDVPFSRPVNGPAGGRLSVNGARRGKSVLRKIGGRGNKFHRWPCVGSVLLSDLHRDLGKDEVSVRSSARTAAGQLRIAEGLEPNRIDTGQIAVEHDGVGIFVGINSRKADRAVIEFFGRGSFRRGDAGRPSDVPIVFSRGGETMGQVVDDLLDLLFAVAATGHDVGLRNWHDRFIGIVQERHNLVVLALRDGVVFVRMALAAQERQPQPGCSRRGHAIGHGMEPELERINPALFIEHRVAMEPRGDLLRDVGIGQHVPGNLLDGETVKRHVVVQRVDHPVAVRPHRPRPVLFVTVRVRIACQVEPFASPAFPIVRRFEQAIDQLLVGVRRLVL